MSRRTRTPSMDALHVSTDRTPRRAALSARPLPWMLAAGLWLVAGCAATPQGLEVRESLPMPPPLAWADDGDGDEADEIEEIWEDVVLEENGETPRAAAGPVGELTRELFRGRHPVTQAEGAFKLDLMWLRTDWEFGSDEDDLRFFLEYGVTDRLTIGGGLGPHPAQRSFERALGGGDDQANLAVMYGVTDDPSEALSVRLDMLYSDDRVEWRPMVLGGKRIDEKTEFYAGAGAALADESGDTERFLYDFAVAHRLSAAVVGVFEFDGALGRHGFHEIYATPGIVFNARQRLQARIGAPIGITSDSADYQLLVGLSIAF